MINKGSLVLYKNQCALVTETGEKITIQFSTTSGKKNILETQKVREKDICFLHSGPLSHLNTINDSTPQEKTNIQNQLLEIWELLSAEQIPFYTLSDIGDLVFEKVSPEDIWALYTILWENPWYQKLPLQPPEQPCFSLRSKEEAEALIAKESEKEKENENRQGFITRLKQKKLDLPSDGKFMQEVEALALGKTDKSKVLKEAGFKETPEKAHSLLLETGIWTLAKNPHPSRWGLSMQSATEHLAKPVQEERMVVHGISYAIDNKWSTDPDDAIAFDGTYVWIHIADPAATVLPDSKIDIAARNRGATLYIPEGASRMLSEECLEDYALGLGPLLEDGSPSLSRALSFRIKLDNSGAIEQSDIFKTLVKVQRLTYEEADEKKDTPELAPLFAIAKQNEERRLKAGAVSITLPEIHISVDKTDVEPKITIEKPLQTLSSSVVREMMLLAGEGAARFAFKNNIPFPYVSQDTPDIPKELPEGLAGQYRLRRSMKSRSVGITPSQHAGLGLGMYSQVTSPLRRYGDLVAHQQLRAFLDNKAVISKDDLLERISAGDAASSAATKAERKSTLHWTLVYLKQRPEWTGEAIVVELKGKQVVILIPEIGQEAVINGDSSWELNHKLTVRAGNITIPELSITYIPIE